MACAIRTQRTALTGIATLLLFTACSAPTQTSSPNQVQPQSATTAAATEAIEIDGSSTVYPITEAVVKAFRDRRSDVEVTAAFSGTSSGFRKFCAGETDINDASRPISTEEMAACNRAGIRFLELPIAFDALTIAVNPQNDWAQELTVEELKRAWEAAAEGKITNWNQIRSTFPNRPLRLYGAGTDSGTYDYFAEVITGEANTRRDYTASEDDNVLVQGVSRDPNALGYFGFSYFETNQNQLKALAIDNGSGAVAPSRQTVEDAKYQPLSRPLFIYVNAQASQENPALRDFVEFYLKDAITVIESVDYIPLPQEAYDINQVHFYQGEVGSAYEGKPQPNLTIEEVLRKERTF
ncbi:PstS family phosphate ABC transporter substrate-binding protein [Microcoleus sp. FACHB-1515]|uniref:PstS family phosphate ABC transporter substrate-binding protein n=1 Tax=Cyanophyceae TaxID=3028117 RepID=UPI0016859967|nr:PstS family phosphate ABC transporter substrate-binding protein [Microcoleus sp. FACHB-1515]MBD2093291.1 PstS family phosphate ABC transporter substrate-binding protein [Microcoleus sp. FACHB-1515]